MQTADSRLRAIVFSTFFNLASSSLDRPPNCCSSDLAAENGGSPRIRTELRGLRDRRFASKLATQKTTATRRRS